jgi:hypothetical protein
MRYKLNKATTARELLTHLQRYAKHSPELMDRMLFVVSYKEARDQSDQGGDCMDTDRELVWLALDSEGLVLVFTDTDT